MTQKQLILKYINEYGSITPARMSGKIYKGTMFGSEASRVCRTLRAEGKVQSERDGKFEKFFITKEVPFSSHIRFNPDGTAGKCSCQIGKNHSV